LRPAVRITPTAKENAKAQRFVGKLFTGTGNKDRTEFKEPQITATVRQITGRCLQ
jgi:hypothetical protein